MSKKFCKHEKFKVAELLFNKYGNPIATLICCLKCGASEKIIQPIKFKDKINKNLKKIQNEKSRE
jgi:hypothetical protein